MRFGRVAGWVAMLTVVVGAAAAPAGAAPTTARVDVSSGGATGNAGLDAAGLAMSANGRVVVFASAASNLVAGDTNGTRDVFVRDVRSGATARVSLGPGNVQGDGDSFGPLAVSGDGRFVAFESDSSNFAARSGCTPGNGGDCLYVRDRRNGTIREVRRARNPEFVALSDHGRYLVTTLTSGPIVRIDLQTGAQVVVSCCGLGTDFKDATFGGMSANANLITFGLDAGSAGGDAGLLQVFVRNIARHRTTMVSRASHGALGNGESFAGGISPDGRYVIFSSSSTNLVPGDTNGHEDVFVCDRRRGVTTRIDRGPGLVQANADGRALGISSGGRFRVYASAATNLVRRDTNHAADIFVHDRRTGRTYRIDLAAGGGQANRGVGTLGAQGFAMTPGGRFMLFGSRSSNLVAANPNAFLHAYRRGPLF
jgi:Tol biopolymer transport system component